ncbi:glucose-6-phosphate isomerase [Brevibacterium sp.]|uniref:glucose-6-phosphate isomerase n=1 Tax=Brevibacterium sp. TaxID=1701 RepID=UPI0025BA2BFB|nr:glucose-6-phosphate isomerase [Brevibacterium sp.]
MSATVGFPAPEEHRAERGRMIAEKLASRLAARDTGLWGPGTARTAEHRLGWTDLHTRSAGLVEQIDSLREELAAEGVDRIVLAGMGGSSLGAEVIAASHGAELAVLDSTDPLSVRAVVESADLARTALVVGTKSGTTIETVSAASAYAQALRGLDIEPTERLIAVTDPGTTLAEQALEEGWRRVFLADPDVGGRFSVLGAFGLVPAGLAGADVAQVVAEAAAVAEALAEDGEGNPAVELASALSAAHARSIRILAVAATDPALEALPAWLEQLVAESTGKDGAGVLPIACESVHAAGFADADAGTGICFLGEALGEHQPVSGVAVSCEAPLGAQFLIWETATALLGAAIGVDPFDQPDVEAAKARAREILARRTQAAAGSPETGGDADGGAAPAEAAQEPAPFLVEGEVEVYASVHLIDDLELHERTLSGLLGAILPERDDERYLAVCAYLSSVHDAEAARLRPVLADRADGAPVSFGWGPRYLHSTGQLHKGGPDTGSFLFVTAAISAEDDLAVPGAGFGFGSLISSQAAADADVLEGLGRRVLRVRLRERDEGLQQLLAAAAGTSPERVGE